MIKTENLKQMFIMWNISQKGINIMITVHEVIQSDKFLVDLTPHIVIRKLFMQKPLRLKYNIQMVISLVFIWKNVEFLKSMFLKPFDFLFNIFSTIFVRIFIFLTTFKLDFEAKAPSPPFTASLLLNSLVPDVHWKVTHA